MAASNTEEEEELMIVTVDEDGDLRFHPEVLESLLNKIKQQSKNPEIPVVIIGVIGEPNTNKACFVNLIRYYIDSINSNNQSSKDLDWIPQVWNDVKSEKRLEYGNVKYGLSIESSKPRLINTKDGCEVVVLVLDIWYSNDELLNGIKANVYKKLIDLCLYLSSVVVYTGFGTSSESSKTIKDYLWIPSDSEVFKNLDPESFQRLFIILQEWSFFHLQGFGKDGRGPKSFLESKSQPFSPLSKIKTLSTELKSKFQNAVCYLLPSEKREPIRFPNITNQLIQNILYNPDYTLTPVFRQSHTITIKSLESLFCNGVSISSNPCILTEDFSEENPKSAYRDKLRRRQNENEKMDEKQETKDISQSKRYKNEPNKKNGEKKQEDVEKQPQNSKQKTNNNQQQQQSSNQEYTQKKTNNIDQHQPQSKKSTSDISIEMEEATAVALTKSSVTQEELYLKTIVKSYRKEMGEKFHDSLSVDKLYFEEDELKKMHSDILNKIINEARDKFCLDSDDKFFQNFKSSTHEYYHKICTENSGRQKKYEKLKNDSTKWSQDRLKIVQDWMKKFITKMSHEVIHREVEDFLNKEANNFLWNLELPWKTHFSRFFDFEKNKIIDAVNSLLFGIKSYEEKMTNILKKSIYLPEDDFEGAHASSFQESIVENPGSGEELFKDSMNKAVLHIKSKLVKPNSVTAGLEEKISKDALDLVTVEYHKFMKSQVTQNRILTDRQIEQLHTKAANLLTNSFIDNPDFNFTPVWKIRQNELHKILNDGKMLDQYLQENQRNIKILKVKRKNIMEEAERTYKESMNYFLQTAQLTESRMNFFHETSMKKGLDLYVDKMGRDGSIDWDRWGNILTDKMNNLAQFSVEENGITIPVSESSYSQDEIMMEEIQNQNFGVGIYIGPNIIMSSVLKEGDKLSEFSTRPETLQLSPFITFMNEKICFGEEAKEMTKSNNYNCINIYEILTPSDTSNVYTTVQIYGETFKLRPEEILALFLHHLKLELENKCALDSPINSCVVASSAFIPGAGKKILKNALILAGFHNSTLIHTTTAIGISYQLAEKPKHWPWFGGEYSILAVHEAPGVFDVALIFASDSSGIKVKSTFGLPDIPKDQKDSHWLNWSRNLFKREPTPQEIHEKNTKNLIRETLQNSYTYNLDEIIMIDVNEVHRKAVVSSVNRVPKKVDNNLGILVGATALSLSLNARSTSVLGVKKSLEYEERTPFQFSLEDSDGKVSEIILKKNVSIIPRNLKCNLGVHCSELSSHCLRLTERSTKSSGDTQVVGWIMELEIPPMETLDPVNITFNMSMSTEGVLDVVTYLNSSNPGIEIPIIVNRVFMDEDELRNSMKTLAGIFPRNKKNEKQPMAMEKLQLPSSNSSSSSNNTTVQQRVSSPSTSKKNLKTSEDKSTQNSNSKIEEARAKLSSLVDKVNEKIETVDQSKPIIKRIQELIEESQKMVKNDKATLTMLEVQYQKLDKGAARIKV